ncbi:two-component regulator propeller domain-containing protein [Algibacter miyuki]|uniref:histidine kinase n=1 Tax=Algibacter miyuki TaxID=1306933 RepID=A0ABV5GZW6_9FLAO|nr:hybrid sensor histidine kinase/response regulator transcription factor [Algibacter miyuki]MDN3666794.1 two-component regulator propeller domain-containing protein [Algibacter miyuki]
MKQNNPISIFKSFLVLLLFWFYSTACFAQLNTTDFHELDIHGVLFNKKVNVLFMDSYGYLWIGSNSGLYKYDGHNLTTYQYDVFDNESLPNNSITSIIEDDFNNLWIGSESFLIHYDRKKNTFKGLLKNIRTVVKQKTSNGDIWVSLRSIGLLKIPALEAISQTDLPTLYTSKPLKNLYNTRNQNINALVEDSFNRFWIASNKGISILNKDYSISTTNFSYNIIDIKLFDNNKLLAISQKDLYILGYNKSDHNLEILESYPNINESFSIASNLTTTTLDDKTNDLWIGSTTGLIKATRLDNSYHFNYYSKDKNDEYLPNNHISSTLFDSYGNLWIGSHKGVNKYLGRTSLFEYNQVSKNNSLTFDINSLNKDNLLVGALNGIYYFNPTTKVSTKIKTPFNDVHFIAKTYENNDLFIANKLSLYQSKNYQPGDTSLDLTKIKTYEFAIKHITPISKNELWVALWSGGIDIINDSQPFSEFKKQVLENLKHHHTSTFLLTKENKLWIGTRGEGLYVIDLTNERFKHYLPTKENGLTANAILSLHEDETGNIWVGTRGGGLNMYQKELDQFKNFKETNSYSPKIISAIEADFKGNLWMSTRDGLTMFNTKTQKFIPFGVEDGINENQFVFNSSSANPEKNILYFGCSDGFYSVHTNKLIPQNILPNTVITSFSTLGETANNNFNSAHTFNINSGSPIVLPYNQNNISVNFSSLDLTAPNKNQYAYQLKGLNNYWIYTNAFNRNANYNDLSPGTYTFMVKSANSDGVWNETPSEVTFTIEPPIWKSTWAILTYILLAILILYISSILIRRWYLLKKNLVKETISREKDNELNRMKMIFFTDISHELRTPLSLILGTIEKVVKEKKFTLSPLTSQRIYNNTLRMHRLINQIMDIRKFDEGKFKLKISKNDIVQDITTIKNAFNDFAKIYSINYHFVPKTKQIKGWYDVDLLEKILFNLLSNAFKYTKEHGEITISLDLIKPTNTLIGKHKLEGKHIKCSVRDNGIGIPQKDLEYIFDRYYQATKSQRNQIPGTGIGMELVQKLIERHHGTITVESEEHVFTEFTFYLPISKNQYSKHERSETGTPLKRNFIKNSEYQVIEEVSSEFTANEANQPKKSKILIVEDSDDLRQMVVSELKPDFNVIEAINGVDGYNMALKEKPDLIVSDILMPIEDGISMLKRIKKNPIFNNIPIFMLTAKNSEESKIECLSLGANDYIEKPFSLEFLKWKIKNTFKTRHDLKEKYSKLITTAPVDVEVDSNDEKFIKKLIKIIEDNLNNNILNVEFLASEIGMSRANLYRKVQQILNDTPVNFIKTIKLKRAAQLLKQDKMYISEVAYMTGFNNQKYFSKCFNKEYGISPTAFAKQNKTSENVEGNKEDI